MQKANRLSYILDVLRQEGSVSVKYLTHALDVSESTIRRDIQELFKITQLPLKRVHSGVILNINKSSIEPMFEAKLSLMKEEKRRIAETAMEYIDDGDSIILDSGTTSFYLARLLHKRKGLKVITTDLKNAEELSTFPDIESYVIGGIMRSGYYSIGGSLAELSINQFNVEKAFLTADAVNLENGVFNFSMFEVGVKKALVKSGKEVILLADHSKLGQKGFVKVCDLSDINIFITSKGGDSKIIDGLSKIVENVIQA